jgi:hypothetical protein
MSVGRLIRIFLHYRVMGRTPRLAQFTNTLTSRSGKSDSEDDAVQHSIENLMLVNKQGG